MWEGTSLHRPVVGLGEWALELKGTQQIPSIPARARLPASTSPAEARWCTVRRVWEKQNETQRKGILPDASKIKTRTERRKMQARRLKDTILVSKREGVPGPHSLKALIETWWKSLSTQQRSFLLQTFDQKHKVSFLVFFIPAEKVFTADERQGVHCTISQILHCMKTHTPSASSTAEMHKDQPLGAGLTLCVLEGTKDFPLGCYPLDVWMVFKSQQPRLLFLFYLNHLKITRVVTGWIVSRYNSPVVDCTALQGACNVLWNQWPQNKNKNLRTYILTLYKSICNIKFSW